MEEDARLVEEPGTMNTEPRRPGTEYRTDSLAAGIKATGSQGEAKAAPHDERETVNRIPIWVVEEDVGDGLLPERTYSHSSLGPPIGYVVMPAGMHADRHADHIRFGMDPPKPGACGVLLASLSTRRVVEAAIVGEFGLSWRSGESPASSSDRGGGAGAGHGESSTSASSLSSLFAQHQKAALDLYDAIYRQAEPIVGPVDGGPLAQVEALANEIRGLRASLSACLAERDALIRAALIENPPGRFIVGLGDKVSVMPCGRYEAVALVRQVACIGDGSGEPVADRADAHLWAANERLEAERDKVRAELDALMALIVQPWARDGDGAQLWKVNLAWWETATSREEGVAMVRKAAGLEAKP